MKRQLFHMLAIAAMMAVPAFFTSCQVDSPEINYTMNVNVNNDFTNVVEAINDGSLRNEAAIAKMVEAIDKMNSDQTGKLQALIDVITSMDNTLDARLAAIEAAIRSQTLSLEGKLDLLEAAIKALPDYSKKFDAVVNALDIMKSAVDRLGTGQQAIADQIANTIDAIDNLIGEVNAGNTDEAEALVQIIQKLEELKTAIEAIETGGGGGGENTSEEDYVDIGLSVKWAKCNLGASKPSEYGDYYAWGETTPKDDYTWATYKWMQEGKSSSYYITKYTFADKQTRGIWYDAGGHFTGDSKTSLDAEDDAATATLGSLWRMPTTQEINELISNCTWTWTTLDGVNGYEVKGTSGNSIFLPAAGLMYKSRLNDRDIYGYYWSSSLSERLSDIAKGLSFASKAFNSYSGGRNLGIPVRPVYGYIYIYCNTVTLDGVNMPILSAAIDRSDLEEDNYYDIYLFLSEDKKQFVEIMANGNLHDGKTIDLTCKEVSHEGWYWSVEMRDSHSFELFCTFGEPGSDYTVFKNGTLMVKRDGSGTEFEIKLQDGRVKDEKHGDRKEHTVTVDFKGVLALGEF